MRTLGFSLLVLGLAFGLGTSVQALPMTLQANGTLLPSEAPGLDPALEQAAWSASITFDPSDIVLVLDRTAVSFRVYGGGSAPIHFQAQIGAQSLSGTGEITVGDAFFIANGPLPGQPPGGPSIRLDTWAASISGTATDPSPVPGLPFSVALSLDGFVNIVQGEVGPVASLDFFIPDPNAFDQARLLITDDSGSFPATVAQGVATSVSLVPEPAIVSFVGLALLAGLRGRWRRG